VSNGPSVDFAEVADELERLHLTFGHMDTDMCFAVEHLGLGRVRVFDGTFEVSAPPSILTWTLKSFTRPGSVVEIRKALRMSKRKLDNVHTKV
jgi:hypothetical protein